KIKSPKKLIEVALPLDAINKASAREKSIRHGHPSTLHLWWARRPLASARAVIFAQMVNDPGQQDLDGVAWGLPKREAQVERERLFSIIEDLVKWENTNNEEVLERARAEIWRSWREVCELNGDHPQAAELFDPNKLPAFHDPFAGGGSLPLEAQRLGLESYASDLNPVAVLINKAMIDIPQRFRDMPPVGPLVPADKQPDLNEVWSGSRGLAEDVRRYGAWMRLEAEKRIGHLYPKVTVTAEMATDRPDLVPLVGKELTVVAWIWARTVRSPNPMWRHAQVPLAGTFVLSDKAGKEAYVQPVVDGDSYRFVVKVGTPPDSAKRGTKLSRGASFGCLLSDTPIEPKHIKSEGVAGRMGARLMAIVAEGKQGRVYLSPEEVHQEIALSAPPAWKPEIEIPPDRRAMFTPLYGLTKFGDLFTSRQLVALNTFYDLVSEAIAKVKADCTLERFVDQGIEAGTRSARDDLPLEQGGTGATAYSEAVGLYLAFAVDKGARYWSSLCVWSRDRGNVVNTFGRQTLPMVWDYVEANPLSQSSGNFLGGVEQAANYLEKCIPGVPSTVEQCDAAEQDLSTGKIVCTDPPYYDNIGYADLSDFFYGWLRRVLRTSFPSVFVTMAAPKDRELVATPFRHGGKQQAAKYFLDRLSVVLSRLAQQTHPGFPVTVYYAFRESETTDESGTTSTGWQVFLDAVIRCGFAITGTWPMRTEYGNLEGNRNALASSVIVVCRKRPENAPKTDQRHLIHEIASTLPNALDDMTHGTEHSPISPVDLSQAIIGPGMAIYSKYSLVQHTKNSTVSVKDALALINRFLAEEDFDHDTQFCLNWFTQYGLDAGPFGEADLLARAKSTSVDGVVKAGVVESGGGKVRLLRWREYPRKWDPLKDPRIPIWKMLHQVSREFQDVGDYEAASILVATG
ncbi:MAG: DUF1156 domain-containing protein, partial [Polyangiaceae bacterium]|nr:DUF1156 domain-containing protein [Polyangiaceae bacterium]